VPPEARGTHHGDARLESRSGATEPGHARRDRTVPQPKKSLARARCSKAPPPRRPAARLPDGVSQNNEGAVRAPPPNLSDRRDPVPRPLALIETLGVVRNAGSIRTIRNTYKATARLRP
jgi:hypothetical protein